MPARQEVLNVMLAEILEERGFVAAPEEILRHATTKIARMPDVLVDYQGLRLAIEAEFASTPNAKQAAYDKAKLRVTQGIAHIGAAIIYPARLRPEESQSASKRKQALKQAKIEFVIVHVASVPQAELFPNLAAPDFDKGSLDNFMEAIRRSYEQLARDETLELAVNLLHNGIEEVLYSLESQPAAIARMAESLGMKETPAGNSPMTLTPRERKGVTRIGALIIANAMIFQEVLSQNYEKVMPLSRLRDEPRFLNALAKHWKFILTKINYQPVFYTALKLLFCLSADDAVRKAVLALLDTALKVVEQRVSLRHDLAGRIYHRILTEAKYLGAFYTAIPSATLLLKLAMQRDSFIVDWSSLAQIGELRIADLACGTGTLLMASADTILDNYARACAERGQSADLVGLQNATMGQVIHGYDVLPSAIHLTASTLTLRVPEAPVEKTHLYRVPLGGPSLALGTLEFLEHRHTVATLFSKQEQVVGKRGGEQTQARLPDLDLAVMNPPFTRSVGCNLLFGNLPDGEREAMQEKLSRVIDRKSISANITAGLGSVFVALADAHLKPGGHQALVLPRALISGEAWGPSRDIINKGYDLEYLIVSQDPRQWNFSENTSLSEVLAIARKLPPDTPDHDSKVICVNLWKQPKNSIEALSIASSIIEKKVPDLETGQGALAVTINGIKIGEAVSVPWYYLKKQDTWGFPCSFAQAELLRALFHLTQGRLYLPGEGLRGQIPLCQLREFGKLGYDRRDIKDGFDDTTNHTAYASFWGHSSGNVLTIKQKVNRWLEPLSERREGRTLRNADHLWTCAGRLLFSETFRMNTMRLPVVRVDQKVLSNVWWSFVPEDSKGAEVLEKCLALWLNSTLGILMFSSRRVDTEGSLVHFKKPALLGLPVLDIRQLTPVHRQSLANAYDDLAKNQLGSLPEAAADQVRAAIDGAVADALGLPDLAILRETLTREPVICATTDRLFRPLGHK